MTVISTLNTVLGGVSYMVQNSGASDSLTQLSNGALQFEVDPGAVWQNDPTTLNRSEIASTQLIPNGTGIQIGYDLTVQSGAISTDPTAWAVLGQLHQNDGTNTPHNSPPFAVTLVGGKMGISIGYTDASGTDVSHTIWTDPNTIVQGADYAMDISVTFDPKGIGHLKVVRNGITIVDYSGPLGYDSQSSVYWKEGIYKLATTTSMVADYANQSLTTGTASKTTLPSGVYSTIQDYDPATGNLVTRTNDYTNGSRAVTTYYASGVVSQVVIINANGSSETDQYSSDGTLNKKIVVKVGGASVTDWYTNGKVTQQTETTAAGVQSLLEQFNANGILTYTAQTAADGTMTYTRYNASGTMIQQAVRHPTGYREVTAYGITGKAYTSLTTSFNILNQVIAVALYRADGSLLSNKTYRADGSKLTLTYDTSGNVTSSLTVAANGAREIYNYNIQGQKYTSDHIMYNSAGQTTFLEFFLSNGQLEFSKTFGSNGTSNFYLYGSSGNVSQRTTTQADGSAAIYDYAADGTTILQQRNYDTSGNLTQITQYNSAGSTIFIESLNSDGSNVQSNYNSSGNLIQRTFINADHTSIIYTYSASDSNNPTSITNIDASGDTTRKTIYNSNGTTEVDYYNVTGTPYLANQIKYDSSGNVVSNIVYNANGTKASSQITGSDGTVTANNYGSTGLLQQSSIVYADGSSDVYQYGITTGAYVSSATHYDAQGVMTHLVQTKADNSTHVSDFAITGQSYTTQVANYDPSGVETSMSQYHADGTLAYSDNTASDGTKTVNTYDYSGNMTSAIATAPDATITGKAYAAGIGMVSGTGDDIFTSFHNDSFSFHANSGNDTIYAFNGGTGSLHDILQIDTSLVADYAHLTMAQSGSDSIITLSPHDSITLKNTSISALVSSDFKFV